ncbi:hypothetical protein DEU56DRAFT_984878 [Suillus clintonianus]|uniref:uncharacterized protein n=1 Tax=Suillus clintonianus TaxID=1904413 RepID=UPI001B87F462|nr:uncharacterized protein DEU56DRAFT_984878 [Suillus clintonianus]KAG2116827.1 hypothetical protein DEU56DRAFT_984878 [Suillus clintonianus]
MDTNQDARRPPPSSSPISHYNKSNQSTSAAVKRTTLVRHVLSSHLPTSPKTPSVQMQMAQVALGGKDTLPPVVHKMVCLPSMLIDNGRLGRAMILLTGGQSAGFDASSFGPDTALRFYHQLPPPPPPPGAKTDGDADSAHTPVELVTVPALGLEWQFIRDENSV